MRIILLLVALIAIGGFLFYRDLNQTQLRLAAMQKQRETLIQYWQSQGLSEADIQKKLAEQRTQNPGGYQPSLFQSLFRTVRHATGTGPGVRPQ